MNTSATTPAHTPDVAELPAAAVANRPSTPAVAPGVPRDTLGEDVRSSLMLFAATGTFAFAVVALGSLASGIPG